MTKAAADPGCARASLSLNRNAEASAAFPLAASTLETRSFYARNADAYAEATLHRPLDAFVLEFAGLLPSRARILDLGAGSGRDLKAFAAMGYDTVGLDSSPAMARVAHQSSGASIIVGDMTLLPCADASFDGCWASASLLHLAYPDMAIALDEVRRVLRPGGVLFSSMKRGTGEAREPGGRWLSYVDTQSWRGMLRDAGFAILCSAEQTEARSGGTIPWLTCLAQRS